MPQTPDQWESAAAHPEFQALMREGPGDFIDPRKAGDAEEGLSRSLELELAIRNDPAFRLATWRALLEKGWTQDGAQRYVPWCAAIRVRDQRQSG